MNAVTNVEPMPGLRLKLTFADGFSGIVDMQPHLGKGFTAELLDPEKFSDVSTEPGGGVAWPNGFDVCPEFLRDLAEKRQAAAGRGCLAGHHRKAAVADKSIRK